MINKKSKTFYAVLNRDKRFKPNYDRDKAQAMPNIDCGLTRSLFTDIEAVISGNDFKPTDHIVLVKVTVEVFRDEAIKVKEIRQQINSLIKSKFESL